MGIKYEIDGFSQSVLKADASRVIKYTRGMQPHSWRYRRFHVSYLIGWLCLGVLIGLVFGREVSLTNDVLWIWFGLIALLGAFRSLRWWSVPVVICAGLSFGLIRGHHEAAQYTKYDQLLGNSVTLQAKLAGDPQTVPGGRQRLTLTKISIAGEELPGDVFATMYGSKVLKRGDHLTVSGSLREGFGAYGATMSAVTVTSVERPDDVIRDVRESFAYAVRSVVIEPIASLGLGFVVGQRSTLPDTLDEQLKIVGLTHIVVASGYNLTILARFVMRLLSKRSRYLALICSLTMVTLFALFSGFSPSMNRAVVVTVLGLLAWYVGRRFHPLLLVAFVAAGTALYNPMFVWADLGWYLSFFAFIGVLAVAPLVVGYLYRDAKPGAFVLLVIETLAAEMMALPIIAFAFSSMPSLGLIANVLVAPFIPAAMALTALTGLTGMMSQQLAAIPALPTELLIGYIVAVVEWLSSLPFAERHVELGFGILVGWYLLVLTLCLIVWRRSGYDFRRRDDKVET